MHDMRATEKRLIQRLSNSLYGLLIPPPLSPGKYGMSLQMLLGLFMWYWNLIILRNDCNDDVLCFRNVVK